MNNLVYKYIIVYSLLRQFHNSAFVKMCDILMWLDNYNNSCCREDDWSDPEPVYELHGQFMDADKEYDDMNVPIVKLDTHVPNSNPIRKLPLKRYKMEKQMRKHNINNKNSCHRMHGHINKTRVKKIDDECFDDNNNDDAYDACPYCPNWKHHLKDMCDDCVFEATHHKCVDCQKWVENGDNHVCIMSIFMTDKAMHDLMCDDCYHPQDYFCEIPHMCHDCMLQIGQGEHHVCDPIIM